MTQGLTQAVEVLQVRNTLYDSRLTVGVKGLQVRTTLYDSRFDSGSERVTS